MIGGIKFSLASLLSTMMKLLGLKRILNLPIFLGNIGKFWERTGGFGRALERTACHLSSIRGSAG